MPAPTDDRLAPAPVAATHCRYCDLAKDFDHLRVRELYFGTLDEFDYLCCRGCGSLMISKIPENLSQFYRPGYGGHIESAAHVAKLPPLRKALLQARSQRQLGHFSLVGQLLATLRPVPEVYPWVWLRAAGATVGSRILDVGCGGGSLLKHLHAAGFDRLSGIDAFVPHVIEEAGLKITRGDAMAACGRYDLVMMNHSLEHMPDPAAVVRHLASLLDGGGALLIRVPVAGGVAQQMFGAAWYGIDAPRHLAIPSLTGMQAFASRLGLKVDSILFDSTASQFFVSEGYQNGLSMQTQRANDYTHVSAAQMKSYAQLADEANRQQTGDQAAFILRPL